LQGPLRLCPRGGGERLKLDPKREHLEEGFTRDVTDIGHLGTGDLEVAFHDRDGLEKAKSLILKAYQKG
jgi:predicted transport protein